MCGGLELLVYTCSLSYNTRITTPPKILTLAVLREAFLKELTEARVNENNVQLVRTGVAKRYHQDDTLQMSKNKLINLVV